MVSGGYRPTFGFNLGMSAYWFASSYKWFILLFILIPDKVSQIVPGGEKGTTWGLILGTGAVWALFGPAIFGRMYELSGGWLRNRGPWIGLGSALTAVAVFVVFGAESVWMIAVGYFLLQVSDDLGTGPYAGMVADTVPAEHRGFASSVLGGFKLFGQIASAIAALILGRVELIFAGIALVNVLCAAWTIWTIRDLPNAERITETRGFVADYVTPFKSYDFRAVWFNRFIVAFAYGCVTGYALYFLQDMLLVYRLFTIELGGPSMAAQVLALTISFAGILGAVMSARVADKTGRKPLLILSAGVLATALFPVAFLRDFTPIWGCVFLFGIGLGIYQSSDWAVASDVLPNPDRAATEMGAWQSSETSVQILVGLVMGPVIDGLNRVGMGYGYMAMVFVACSLFLISMVAVRAIRSAR
ncbi:hypothetical protein CCB80_02345 [Armatimonadetes bacterium Uphvl-Ar1]|nr:hypothetical protein CCB80_02345 [Armatimonadetes bacterium Uphvl-Ar1]